MLAPADLSSPLPALVPVSPDPVRPRQQPCPDPPTRRRPCRQGARPQRRNSVHGAPVGAHTLAEGQVGGADTSGDATIGLSDEFMMNRQLTRATSRPARSPAAAPTRPSCAPRDADRPAPGHRRGRTPALGPPATGARVPAVRRLVIRQELHRHRPQSRARPPPVPPTAIKPLQDPGPSGATHIGTASGVNAPVLRAQLLNATGRSIVGQAPYTGTPMLMARERPYVRAVAGQVRAGVGRGSGPPPARARPRAPSCRRHCGPNCRLRPPGSCCRPLNW